MSARVTFYPANVSIDVSEGTSVLDAARGAGVIIEAPCGGSGTCGRCGVVVEGMVSGSDLPMPTRVEGRRLACQTLVAGDLSVLVPPEGELAPSILASHHRREIEDLSPMTVSSVVEVEEATLDDPRSDAERLACLIGDVRFPPSVLRSLPSALGRERRLTAFVSGRDVVRTLPGEETARTFGLAVDIGTTTVVATIVDLNTGNEISSASDYNRQLVCGEDVLSRIAFSEERGTDFLRRLVLETIDGLIEVACQGSAGVLSDAVGREDIVAAVISGNTVMAHLLLGIDPRGIRYEPYSPVVRAPGTMPASEACIGIAPEAPILIVPAIAGYVGGDITSDIVASGMHRSSEISLLIDVGTNGEIALGNDQWMMACSSSAGPAFEGGEVRHGMRAMTGAIDSVTIAPSGEVECTTIGNAPPRGICGSGLIDLIAQLLLRGLVDGKGHLRGGEEFEVAEGITVSNDDIQNIVRTKGAVYAACSTLVRSVGLSLVDVERVYVAGGFGNYVDLESAVTIGLLPDLPRERFAFLANASIAGAREALLSAGRRREMDEVSSAVTYLDLSSNPIFFDEFTSSLFLPHTDRDRFPSLGRQNFI